MSHDADKLIRQLSLVAFLMAERRPVTARDVKSNVEGYSEMSDEAFARRYYADRSELTSLGVPLRSQRDEFTGEELYTLSSEQYFLPPLELTDDELAALQTSLYLLEGKFAYAEPFRLALQNLALGRPGFNEPPTATAVRVEVLDPDYTPETPGRLGKLEAAISKQRTVRFEYWSISHDKLSERIVNPFGLLSDNGLWYVIGFDLERQAMRTFRVSRIRSDIRFATRKERDFRIPPDFDIDEYRGRAPWQIGVLVGEARIRIGSETAWWVERAFGSAGRLDDGVFTTGYSSLGLLAAWVLRQDGRAIPLEPPALCEEVDAALRLVEERHSSAPLEPAPERDEVAGEAQAVDHSSGPVAPERFALLQALLAHLLTACGEENETEIPASEIVESLRIPLEDLEEHLSMLNLVNFGGGCYTVYAELDGDTVRIDKELFGDTFRASPRLTPLEARAIRLALEFVGPMIAADAHTPLERVRGKLEETFGQFELQRTPEPQVSPAEEDLIARLAEGIRLRELVELDLEGRRRGGLAPPHRALRARAKAALLVRAHLGSHHRRRAQLPPRPDAQRQAHRRELRATARFEPRGLLHARQARSGTRRGGPLALGARRRPRLVDGAALAETAVGSPEWLAGEILSHRGEAIVLEPGDLRALMATRAHELASAFAASR